MTSLQNIAAFRFPALLLLANKNKKSLQTFN
jgi:hypothetical protein